MNMVEILFLLCVLLNIFTHATKEDENQFIPGEYKIKKLKSAATATIEVVATNDDIIKMYTTGDIVYVVEVQELKKAKRIRGKLENGLWISLKNTQNEACWVKKLKNKIIEKPSQNVIKTSLTNIYLKAEENLKFLVEECMVCYERFPVSLKFNCGHGLCAECFDSLLKKCNNNNCPKCREPISLPMFLTELLLMINIQADLITPQIPLKELQHAFPLICAIANLTTVKKCMNMGMDVNKMGLQGYLPLSCSLQNDINVVKYLVEKGRANVNPLSDLAVTPLSTSSGNGNLALVKYLIKQGADVNPDDKKGTPLIFGSQNGHLPVVKYLVQNGAKVNQRIALGTTALFMSSQFGHLEIVQYLIKNGANVNQAMDNGATPLFMNCRKNHLEIVQCLVEKGKADVNQAKKDGTTPLLMMRSEPNNLQLVKYLIKNGANVNQANNNGVTPLLVGSQNGDLLIVEYLVENGADVNQFMNNGLTPICVSCQNGHLPVVKYLIKNGANVNQANHDGSTPLFVTIYYKQTEVAKFLLKNTDVNVETTKLFLIKRGLFELVNELNELNKEI